MASLHVGKTLAFDFAHVQIPAQTSGVRVRAVARRGHDVVVDRVFQRGHDLSAAEFHFHQHIGEGQQCESGVHAQASSGHWHAHTPGVLQRKVGAFGSKQEGFGHHLSCITATRQCVGGLAARSGAAAVGAFTGHTHQAQRLGGSANGLGFFHSHLIGIGFQRGGCCGIGCQHLDLGLFGGQIGKQSGAVSI